MNEMSSIPARPIELAIEAPFRLGTLQVTPAALEVRRGQDITTIEPRVMQVLVALHRAGGHVVSREELLELCWEGRIVGDDSLNRSVSQLRKVLASDDGVFVDTIPRVGYRLRWEPEPPGEARGAAPEAPPEASPEAPAKVEAEQVSAPSNQRFLNFTSNIAQVMAPSKQRHYNHKKIIASLCVLAMCGLAAAVTLFVEKPKNWSATGVRPLTQEAGVEMFPAIAPGGLTIAYAAGPGFWAPRDIYLRNVSVGDATPMRLTDTPQDDELSPAWSPSGDRLAFLREAPDGKCTVVVMTPPNGSERIVSACNNAHAGLAWLNASELIIGHRLKGVRARQLNAVDVTSGQMRALTNPPPDMLGDAAPAVSGDGRWVAFRRTAALGSDDIYLLDTHKGTTQSLTQTGAKAEGFTWARDGRTLFFSSNRGGDFGLWAIDTTRTAEPRRVTLGMLPLGRLSADTQGHQIAVETGRIQVNLTRLGPAGDAMPPLTTGEGMDWDPDIRADGTTVFASDRSGTNQIWLRRPDGRIVRLTDINASYVYAPRWSLDGQKIVFVAVVDGRTDIYMIRPDGSGQVRLTEDGAPKGRAIWSANDSQIFITSVNGSAWHVLNYDLKSRRASQVPGSTGITIIERTGERLFALRAGEGTIMELDAQSGAPRALPTRIDVQGYESWAPRSDGIVHVRNKGPAAELWFTGWDGASRRLAPLRPAPRAPFAIASDGGIIAPQLIVDNRDLMLIDLN